MDLRILLIKLYVLITLGYCIILPLGLLFLLSVGLDLFIINIKTFLTLVIQKLYHENEYLNARCEPNSETTPFHLLA